jgi:hypothetical protein
VSILIVWRGAQSKEIDPINYKKEIDENAVGIPPRSRVSQHELKEISFRWGIIDLFPLSI